MLSLLKICIEFVCAIGTSERALWENLADFSALPREGKEGRWLDEVSPDFSQMENQICGRGSKLDFLRIEITQQACISRLIGRLQISFVIKWEDCHCCWKGYKEGGRGLHPSPVYNGLHPVVSLSLAFASCQLQARHCPDLFLMHCCILRVFFSFASSSTLYPCQSFGGSVGRWVQVSN